MQDEYEGHPAGATWRRRLVPGRGHDELPADRQGMDHRHELLQIGEQALVLAAWPLEGEQLKAKAEA